MYKSSLQPILKAALKERHAQMHYLERSRRTTQLAEIIYNAVIRTSEESPEQRSYRFPIRTTDMDYYRPILQDLLQQLKGLFPDSIVDFEAIADTSVYSTYVVVDWS